ncbi:hypothetical protein J6S35_00015, partial [Candidatus Saccharibacteria bacterium]|nr:hypothetical protein [Candidatus Saccharibacteria bacterium]
GYVWFIEQLMDYSLTSELSGFEDGDTVYAKITYSVDGVEKSDTGKFTLNIENDLASLDYDAPVGTRWTGAYISEVNAGDTTVRWPVPSSDASATVYITEIEYTKVKQLDAQYIPIDGDTVRVNANGELEADVQGGPTVVQTTGTSTTDVMSQDATTKMVFDTDTLNQISIGWKRNGNNKIWIGNSLANNHSLANIGIDGILIGKFGSSSGAPSIGQSSIVISQDAWNVSARGAVVLGNSTSGNYQGSILLGYGSSVSAVGQMDIGSTNTSYGYNSSNYRLLTGVYPGQSEHDAATVGQTVGTTETLTISSWSALSASDPYDYSATVTATATINASTGIVELLNDQPVLFGTYGFAIGAVSGQSVTIYSIGQPDASVSLKLNIRNL